MVDRKVIHILAMLIGAGSEPTGTVLQEFFKIMALNQPAIQKAQAGAYSACGLKMKVSHETTELDRVVGSERMPTWDDEPSLPYVRSLIKEVHRYNPIGSLGSSESVQSRQT